MEAIIGLVLIAFAVALVFPSGASAADFSVFMTQANGGTDRVQALAQAIAGIEGGSVSNPGNIKNASGAIAASASLLDKLKYDFIDEQSRIYSRDMTFTELAWMYVCGVVPKSTDIDAIGCNKSDKPNRWAQYVAGQLGVSVDSSVGEYLDS